MPRNIIQYDLLISCPGDIQDEIDLINKSVDKFNQQFSEALGISIRTRHWSKSSYSQSGNKPQNILNEQFVNDCDAAVAIFWTRFGTPTDNFGSGTEEEIENMLSSHKQVFMYFCEKPIAPAEMNTDGYSKIQEFKKRYQDLGLYFTYNTNEKFESLFFAHLTEYFISQKRISAMDSSRPDLNVMGLCESNISEVATMSHYTPIINGQTANEVLDKIKGTFDQINSIHLKNNPPTGLSFAAAMQKPLEIDSDIKEFISKIAQSSVIELEDDFFDLGNLSENSIGRAANILGYAGDALIGTEKEKQKYHLIMSIPTLYQTFMGMFYFHENFKNLYELRLCLNNSGNTYDEDIDITLALPTDSIVTLDTFPCTDYNQKKYLLDDCDMQQIFGIPSTVNYMDYTSSCIKNTFTPTTGHMHSIYGRDVAQEFSDTLSEIFCYEYYPSGDITYIKLHIDYLKQHTSVAFPTVLFFKEPLDNISYELTSKNNHDIKKATLEISTN